MGKLNGGIDGAMVGKLGNHVGRKVKGQNIIAMAPGKRTKPGTAKQLGQQEKMTILFVMMNYLVKFVRVGFSGFTAGMTAVNAAVQYNYKYVLGTAGNYVLDYPNLMFGRGRVAIPENATVTPAVGRKLNFAWLAGADKEYDLATDMSYFLVYSPVLNKFMAMEAVVPRSALTFSMQLPSVFMGQELQVYMMFASDLGKPGDSIHLGEVTVI